MIELMQKWNGYSRLLLVTEHGSVQVELRDKPSTIKNSRYKFTAFLYALFVNEDCRLQGEATKLMDAAEKRAKELGHHDIFLEFSSEETPIKVFRWYERRGYKEVEFGRFDSLMRKEL